MDSDSIKVSWTAGSHFDAHIQNQVISLSSNAEGEPLGVSPKKLLLVALAGCTAFDVASLLPKMRIPFTSIDVSASGSLTDEHPRYYKAMHMVYTVGSTEEYREKIISAIEKSVDKYCGVHEMLKQAGTITWELRITE